MATYTVQSDITRKHTNAYRLAKMASDGRRKGQGVTRKEVLAKLCFDPAPYAKLYACFVATKRGRYIYIGKALADLG